MTTAPLAHTDVIVLDYLAALWAQSEDLAPELRDDLMTTVADYISMRRTSPASPIEDPAEIVRRLGPPEALVAAVRRGHLPPHIRLPALVPPPPPAATGGGAAEYTAIGLITAGAFVLPGVGPVAGMLMASASPHWTPAEDRLVLSAKPREVRAALPLRSLKSIYRRRAELRARKATARG